MSEGKGQQVMDHNSFPLEFQLPDGEDIPQLNKDVINQKFSQSVVYKLSLPPFISLGKYPFGLVTIWIYLTLPSEVFIDDIKK